jgi:hypothetical protein
MDGAIEMALNDGFEEVSRSHGGTTCGQKNIGGFEATLDGGNVGFNAVEELRGWYVRDKLIDSTRPE